ncbi:Uncharacterized protein AKI40_3482 [Enterobacter sp. FY-07]|uniref:lysozyme inhibitor LprI family protein n=1 Tax=Kosakonia oryzendophytica TaxID=1005665 RepID=UPI00078DAC54|nr:lysozyme inhibitor LprI family protein [Kosakonia oryzendophytica]AMO49862.1 Uncharacterized protein AKI40_3482 [Enterobacter sp. FY-07]WBT60213.1 lysozyme inhibitor LprI family protein [Kosakonia oryzendophytica]
MPGCTDTLRQHYTQLFTVAALFAAANAVAATPGEGISGQWRIISVNTDQRAMTYPATKYNDPRLVGRVLNFGQDAIRGDVDGGIDCQQPTYNSQPEMTLNAVIQQTSGEHNDAPVTPVAEDYELNIPGDQKITPQLVSCKQGHLGPDGVVMKNWVALIAADRLITNWSENGYLMLQRVKPGEKTAPSFLCNAKLSTVEKTICDSDELSAWDRSVTDAYQTWQSEQEEIQPADKAVMDKMKSEQRAWLAKRNQCQSDAVCITKAMRERVSEIMSKVY